MAANLHLEPRALAELGRLNEDDWAPVSHGEFVSIRITEMAIGQLKAIEAALKRLDSGDYGFCVDCDSVIGVKRLLALPWASRCLCCQELFDRQIAAGHEKVP